MGHASSPSHRVGVGPGWRWLAVDLLGAPDGVPVVFLHGTPGSRSGPLPRGVVLRRRGVRLISYDRPGYGCSSRRPGRTVASAADDVRAIVDDLGIDRFAVVGRSGGAPHALAIAALLRDRVTAAAALVSLAPADQPDLDWDQGMTDGNVDTYDLADADAEELLASLTKSAIRAAQDPESFFDERVRPGLVDVDRRVVEEVTIRRQLTTAYAEGLRDGKVDGWADDVLALRRDWGFDLGSITAPTLLWHGGRDTFSPVGHTWWLGSQIASAEVRIEPEVGHFGAVEALPSVLSWLVDRHLEVVAGPRAPIWRSHNPVMVMSPLSVI